MRIVFFTIVLLFCVCALVVAKDRVRSENLHSENRKRKFRQKNKMRSPETKQLVSTMTKASVKTTDKAHRKYPEFKPGFYFTAPKIIISQNWDPNQLHAPNLSPNRPTKIEDLVKLHVVHDHRRGCLSNILTSDNIILWNEKKSEGTALVTEYHPGTTLWVNEYLHIGHAQYDLEVIQVLASTKVRLEQFDD